VKRAGLSEAEAHRRLARFGPNRLPEAPPPSRVSVFIRQFESPMVGLLAVAAGVSLVAGDGLEAAVIVAIVLINAVIGYLQEGRAEQAAREVRKLLALRARVVRDGRTLDVAAEEVVPGDVMTLAAGDRIAADGRWLEASAVEVNESILTGESLPVVKGADEPAAAGTTLTRGSGLVLATATGPQTAIGRIVRSASEPRARTPLQQRMAAFSATLLRAVGVVCLLISSLAWVHGDSVRDSFLTGVALAVAAVPEALPAVVTIALALGVRRLARRSAIVRRLPAIETLGSATVICTDKTGTLTVNQLVLDRVWNCRTRREEEPTPDVLAPALLAGDPYQEGSDQPDPVERAIEQAAAAAGLTRAEALAGGTVSHHEPFDPGRRLMSVSVTRTGRETLYLKGAPEAVLALLPEVTADGGAGAVADRWAGEGARVLMVAVKTAGKLRPLGLLRLIDPPRATARASVEEAGRAGIRTLMVTGDHPGTARAVARATGIAPGRRPVEVVTGADLERLDDRDLTRALERVSVFARIAPGQKLRLVRLLAARGDVVAMTGDGVNDVPALRAAHIGVAMGRGGSDAAAAAADVVLADDNYSTIVGAVRDGRTIFENIRHFTLFLLAANLGEVVVFALAVGVGLSAPLTVLQILLVNLLTDGLPAVALAADPTDRDVMRRPPRPVAEGLLDGKRGRLLIAGLALGLASFGAYLIGRVDDADTGRTLAFATLVAGQLLFVYSARSTGPFWRAARNRALDGSVALSALVALATLSVPALRDAFSTTAMDPEQVLAVLALATIPLVADELYKALAPSSRVQFRSSREAVTVRATDAGAADSGDDRPNAKGAAMTTVTNWLDEREVAYELIEHPQAFTARDEASAAGEPVEHAAKSVLLRDGDDYRIALIPAMRRLDVDRVGQLVDATNRLRLATETEMANDFPGLEVGAIPPLGPLLAVPEVIDARLLEHERIVCSAGDHRHLLALDPNHLVRATGALVGDVCNHAEPEHS
jgi:Ca2+-transporting ATPase